MSYKINKKSLNDFISYALETGFTDEESAKEHIEYLIELFNTLDDPITLYRLIFLGSEKDLETSRLGSHYTLSKKLLIENHYDKMLYDYSKFNEAKPYIITVQVDKNEIDFKGTIKNNLAYPHEMEVTLKDKGKKAKLIKIELFKQ